MPPPKASSRKPNGSGEQEAHQAKERQDAEERRRKQEADARERTERQAILAYWEALTPEQQAKLQAEADAQADPEQLASETGPLKSMGQTIRRHEHIRQLLQTQGKLPSAKG